MAAVQPPTREGYLLFLRQIVGIPVEVLPDDAPIIDQSYQLALTMVNPALMGVGGPAIGSVPLILSFKLAIDARGPSLPSSDSTFIGPNPPPDPLVGDKWYNSDEGREYVYYNDGMHSTWVQDDIASDTATE